MSLDIRPNPSAAGSVTGGLEYKGSYNATTNSPDLTSSEKGDFYIVSVGGTLAGVTLDVGDHIVFNQDASSPITSAMFDKIDNTDAVSSVNGQTGPVVLDTDDISEEVGATNLYYTNARFDTQLATKTTDNLTEGSNLYYTDGRFDTRFAAKTTGDLTEGANLYYTDGRFDTRFAAKTTGDLTEGANLYYTNARFDTQLATKTTDNLTEGSNLYYTNARADARIAAANLTDLNDVNYTAGAGIDGQFLKYVNANNRWEAAAAPGGVSTVNGDAGPNVVLDSGDIAEGSNLYYTDGRFDTRFAAKTTGDLTEGANLYYTNARFDTQLATKTTDNLTEGSNLYYTNARADARIAAANLTDLNDVNYTAGAGIDGYVLEYVHANNRWEAKAASGGGASVPTTTAVSQGTDYTISTTSGIEEIFFITPTADISVNLPAAATAGDGYKYNIKNLASGFTLTIDPNSTETIDGSTTFDLASQYQSITIVSDGSNWFII